MKTNGLIGGMSWESSLKNYRILNELPRQKLGNPHSCECIMHSVDFAAYEKLQHDGKWEDLTARMISIAQKLELAGAKLLVICSNTMHLMTSEIHKAEEVVYDGLRRILLSASDKHHELV